MEIPRKNIIQVDDNSINLAVGKTILTEHYNTFTVTSGEELFTLLKKIRPDLILLDIAMPEMNGYEVIKRLKAKDETADIPVIFVTARTDIVSELEGLSLGAIDYISQPFCPPLLLKRIEMHLLLESQKKKLQHYNNNLQEMVKQKTKTILGMQNSVLKTIANLVESRDKITGNHIERTCNYLKVLLDNMIKRGLYGETISSWDLELVLQSSQLHDVGKISIRDRILLKRGKLTDAEFSEMKNHAIYGVKIIESIQQVTPENGFLEHAKIFAGTHHEKWDGTGYPFGLTGTDIPLQGRLMAIADVYDALISTRSYKLPSVHEEAVQIIANGRNAHFDPVLIDLFLSIADEFADIVNIHGR
ncbi:MAG: response regulator [Treponema sp.]|jgi:putative two-component system response regulator|nr:response regulator [Treponema sp.]